MDNNTTATFHIKAEDISKLEQFHRTHFSGQPVPYIRLNSTPPSKPIIPKESEDQVDNIDTLEDDLGYYPDGVRRTLTDAQIAMFRHSEVQRLLTRRRREKERREQNREEEEDRLRRSTRKGKRFHEGEVDMSGHGAVNSLSYDDHNLDVKNDSGDREGKEGEQNKDVEFKVNNETTSTKSGGAIPGKVFLWPTLG